MTSAVSVAHEGLKEGEEPRAGQVPRSDITCRRGFTGIQMLSVVPNTMWAVS